MKINEFYMHHFRLPPSVVRNWHAMKLAWLFTLKPFYVFVHGSLNAETVF